MVEALKFKTVTMVLSTNVGLKIKFTAKFRKIISLKAKKTLDLIRWEKVSVVFASVK